MRKFLAKIYNRLFTYPLADQNLVLELQKICKGKSVSCSVVTKPLQFMNLKGADRDSNNCKILFFADYFSDANKFVDHLKKTDSEWDAIILMPNEKTAFSCILQLENVSELWLACDYGVSHNFFMAEMHNRNSRIKLIEEGVGNYTDNKLGFEIFHPWLNKHPIIAKLSFIPLRNFSHFLSGSGKNLNESKWTDEVHLYYPDFPAIPCRSRNVFRKIRKTPTENFSSLVKLFDLSAYQELEKLHNLNILIFAMNYSDMPDFSQEDYDKYDLLIAKYHPHVKLTSSNVNCEKVLNITGNLASEILIFKLLQQNCRVTLRSKFSSSMIYLLNSPVNIEFEKGTIPQFLAPLYTYCENLSRS